jgi:hypothetical protein
VFACVLEVCVNFTVHLTEDIIRDADAAGLGDSFEPRSNIYTVPKYITVFYYDVAEMDADAEFDALIGRQ